MRSKPKPNELLPAELLPEELLWAQGGHASDVVLTALADGEHAIVPPAVRAHVDGCRACTAHLGNAALLSLHAHREIAFLTEATRAQANEATARRPLPRIAIGLGLAVAVLGLVPSLLEARPEAADAKTFATHTAPALLKGLSTLGHALDSNGAVSIVLTYGSAIVLVGIALAIVRRLPKKEVSS